jgi:hypothetical protein
MYGDGDDSGRDIARYYVDLITSKDDKNAKEKGHKFTGPKAIDKGGKVTGNELLQKELETTKFIVKYLEKVMEDRGPTEYSLRKVEDKAFVWSFPASRPITAKLKDEKVLNLLPLSPIMH